MTSSIRQLDMGEFGVIPDDGYFCSPFFFLSFFLHLTLCIWGQFCQRWEVSGLLGDVFPSEHWFWLDDALKQGSRCYHHSACRLPNSFFSRNSFYHPPQPVFINIQKHVKQALGPSSNVPVGTAIHGDILANGCNWFFVHQGFSEQTSSWLLHCALLLSTQL